MITFRDQNIIRLNVRVDDLIRLQVSECFENLGTE